MRRAIVALLLMAGVAFAQTPPRAYLGYQQITSLSASTALTVPTGGDGQVATLVVIRVETQGVRWRDDGTAPTSSVGMPLTAGDTFTYSGDLSRLRFIEQTASAKINATYYR